MAEKLYDVFISYSSKDAKVINALCHYLEERNLRCFVAYRDVPYGQDWGPYIIKGIKDAKVLVYVHTKSSNKSKETTREINLACKYECEIIPFKIDSIEYIEAKEYRLTDVNWLDAFPGDPSNYFKRLYERLEKHFPERTAEDRLRIQQELKEREAKRKAEDKERNQQRREERNRYWEETLRPLFRKIGKWFLITLAVIAGAVAGTWCIKNCKGTTETATETAVETPAIEQNVIEVVETPATEIQEEPWINEEEEQRQAKLDAQKAQQKKKRQAEEKKKQDEAKFNEYKKKGDDYYLLSVGSPDNKSYKDQAKYYYGLALQYKEDAKVRNRFETLKSKY
ncbi:MAG: toll/interleukin-1 receptor domain-containing protein [Bacteroidales bacterium]|nr:toll/interleukin-1 receptor domain-containing protein [Bacteroidales bacterium]